MSSNRYQNYSYQVSSNHGSQRTNNYTNTSYQKTVQYSNNGNTQTQRVVYYQDSNQQPVQYHQTTHKTYTTPQKTYTPVKVQDSYSHQRTGSYQSQSYDQQFSAPQRKTVEVEGNLDFDEGIDPRSLKEEYIDLDDLDRLIEQTNPELKMHKKTAPMVKKTADEFDMHVSFKPPDSGKYPKDNKRLPKKGERYNDVNTNFGRIF